MNKILIASAIVAVLSGCTSESAACLVDPIDCAQAGGGGSDVGGSGPSSDSEDGSGIVESCKSRDEGLTCALGARSDGGTGTCCNEVCTDFTSDSANCGACGQACPSGQACHQGWCGFDGCTPDRQGNRCHLRDAQAQGTCCGTTCLDTSQDANNCGYCGLVCGNGAECLDSQCQ
jgi:hypothetical protein